MHDINFEVSYAQHLVVYVCRPSHIVSCMQALHAKLAQQFHHVRCLPVAARRARRPSIIKKERAQKPRSGKSRRRKRGRSGN